MNYFIGFEFLEGKQYKRFLGIKYGETKPTIDMISVGIVSEDGRQYYAISKDFNLKEAWNRYQLEQVYGDLRNRYPDGVRKYWLRDNVLKPIYQELLDIQNSFDTKNLFKIGTTSYKNNYNFTYKELKKFIKKYGKTNEQIAKEIKEFCKPRIAEGNSLDGITKYYNPKFYGYYSDYDWVVFCLLFGRMIDLPNEFPMYCIDLKQILDEKGNHNISHLKEKGEHNALNDAHFNKRLYNFLQTI